MTSGERLRAALHTLRWSARDLAEEVGCASRLTQRWIADGQGYTVPDNVLAAVELLAAYKMANPMPSDWRRRQS